MKKILGIALLLGITALGGTPARAACYTTPNPMPGLNGQYGSMTTCDDGTRIYTTPNALPDLNGRYGSTTTIDRYNLDGNDARTRTCYTRPNALPDLNGQYGSTTTCN